MKPTKIKLDRNKGLNLDKQAISKLQESQIASIKGGNAPEAASCAEISCVKSCGEQSCGKGAA